MALEKKLLALMLGTVPFLAKELDERLERLNKALKKGTLPMEQKLYGEFLDNPGDMPLLNLAAEHTQAESFAAVARSCGVDVSVKRDQTAGTYYLCLHGQKEDIIKAIEQHMKQQLERQRSRSVTKELDREQLAASARAATKQKEQERGPIEIGSRLT
jgi:hypothetical protein